MKALVDSPLSTRRVIRSGQKLDQSNPKTLSVRAIGDRKIPLGGLELILGTGEFRTINDHHPGLIYMDSNCSGTPYVNSIELEQRDLILPVVFKTKGGLKWTQGTLEAVKRKNLYVKRDSCKQFSSVSSKLKIYPLKPAPDWIVNAFDNPPYTVKVKY